VASNSCAAGAAVRGDEQRPGQTSSSAIGHALLFLVARPNGEQRKSSPTQVVAAVTRVVTVNALTPYGSHCISHADVCGHPRRLSDSDECLPARPPFDYTR